MKKLRAAAALAGHYAGDLAAAGSLAMIGAGCWMFHPGLGLIVPGGIAFACLAYGRLRG